MNNNEYSGKISLGAGIIASLLIPVIITLLLITNSLEFGNLTISNLSRLGQEGEKTAGLFNSAIIIGGILTIVFAIGLRRRTEIIGRSGFAIFIAAATALTSIGIFNIPDPNHNASAILFFSLMPIALLVMGTNIIRNYSGNISTILIHKTGFGTFVSGIVLSVLSFLMIIFHSNYLMILELGVIFSSSFWLLAFGRKLLVKNY